MAAVRFVPEGEPVALEVTLAVSAEVVAERQRQIDKGWTPEHDAAEGLLHLRHHAKDRIDQSRSGMMDERRKRLIQAAALCVAAVELIDRGAPTGGN
jgi:hypothetical protein